MPFNTTKIENLYCVGDSCFPGQGLNAVAFSGYACAHKIGSKLNINSFKLPEKRKSRTRVGRGNGSKGTYSGRGLKGQKSRSGGGVPLFFEGGQLRLVKRLRFLREKQETQSTHDYPTEEAVMAHKREMARWQEKGVGVGPFLGPSFCNFG